VVTTLSGNSPGSRYKLPPGADVNRRILQYALTFAFFEIDQIVVAVELLIEDGTEPETIALW
jgi:hypothetical protein